MFNKSIAGLALFLAISACDQSAQISGDPKQQLTHYIDKSFAISGPGDREVLLSYLTGEAKNRLASWSDEQFRQAFIETKRDTPKLLIRETKPINANEVNITYELSYFDQSKGKDAKVTNKKLCHMVNEQGKWLIADVHNIKELVEFKNEMSLP
jgi:hypothetical protein